MAGKQGRKGNGEGNVRQRANGLWEARIMLEGGKSKLSMARRERKPSRSCVTRCMRWIAGFLLP
jgi:hypothetical protein